MSAPRVRAATDAFAVTWEDREEAATYWGFDQEHAPQPLVPMAQDLAALWYDHALRMRVLIVNGYLFTADDEEAFPEVPATVQSRSARELWETLYEPRIRSRLAALQETDLATLDLPALVRAVPHVLAESAEAFRDTMYVLPLVQRPAKALLAFCEQHLPQATRLGAELLRGFDNLTTARDTALTQLSLEASARPEALAAVERGRTPEGAAAEPFRLELEAFLGRFGHQVESWFALETPTWQEDPATVLRLVHQRASREMTETPRPALAQREQAIARATAELPTEQLRRELRSKVVAAQDFVRIREDRAYWQLLAASSVRRPLQALGERLAIAGTIRHPSDIYYLHVSELTTDMEPLHAVVERRRADRARWATLLPPDGLGDSSRRPGAPSPPVSSPDDTVLRGVAASPGVVTASARVVLGLDQSNHVSSGDIIVCRATAPPWSPLLAVAGGIVSNSGNALAHTAIIARELGIPCVVGVTAATEEIRDGDLLRVDGTTGDVHILERRKDLPAR